MKKRILIILLILALCISPVASAEWDCFQGDIQHSGFVKDTSDFVTNTWIFNMGSPIIGSPAINGSNMYIASQDGLLKCIDMSEGSEIWSLELDNKTVASPVFDNGTVYIGSTESFYAVDSENGKVLWKADISDVQNAACVYDGKVYVGAGNHIYCLNNDTGEIETNMNITGDVSTSLLIVNDTIYVGSDDSRVYALSLDGNTEWTYTTGDAIESTPTYGDGRIIFGSNDGNLYVLNETDGNTSFKVDLSDSVKASASVDEYNYNIYIGSDAGNFTCIDLRDGTVKWNYNTGSPVESTAAQSGSEVAFASSNGVGYVLDIYTGKEVFTYNPGTMLFNSPITSSPVIYGNSLFFAGHDGYVYALNINKHEVPASIYLFYVLAIIVIVIIAIGVVIKVSKKKKKGKR